MEYTVKMVADVARISVRTLHHYDEIGLLKPAGISPSGYRLYSDSDVGRLQQILFFKELGFNLQEIKNILDSPGYDKKQALHEHKQLLIEKRKRIEGLIRSVEKTIDVMEKGMTMSTDKMFEGFDESKIEEYKQEIREKYGNEKVDECDRKTSKYTKADWDTVKAEVDAINEKLAMLMDEGKSPADAKTQEVIGLWYKHINDRFYTCTPEIFRGLGDLYVDDSRFAAFYEKLRPGMAKFMREAMHIFSDALVK